jgi:hypothetical protein
MTTWNDRPGERDLRSQQPRPLLVRIIEALLSPREPDPNLEYDGPCVGGNAPEAGL